jgi:hypothetical protein
MTRRSPVLVGRMLFVALSFFAQQASAQTTHTQKPTPKTVAWGYYDAKAKPVLTVKSVDTMEIETLITNSPKRLEDAGVARDQVEQSLRDINDQIKDKGPGTFSRDRATSKARKLAWSQCDVEFWAEFPGMPRNQLCERVGPAQPGETSEVAVGGVEDAAVLDGQRRQVCVTDQRTASLAIQQHLPEQAPVLISGCQEAHVRLPHPLIYNLDGFLGSEPLSGESWVRDNPEKGRHRLPW